MSDKREKQLARLLKLLDKATASKASNKAQVSILKAGGVHSAGRNFTIPDETIHHACAHGYVLRSADTMTITPTGKIPCGTWKIPPSAQAITPDLWSGIWVNPPCCACMPAKVTTESPIFPRRSSRLAKDCARTLRKAGCSQVFRPTGTRGWRAGAAPPAMPMPIFRISPSTGETCCIKRRITSDRSCPVWPLMCAVFSRGWNWSRGNAAGPRARPS